MVRVLSLALAALIGSLVGTTVCASAQSYPQQVVHVVVPFSAGSITDESRRSRMQPAKRVLSFK